MFEIQLAAAKERKSEFLGLSSRAAARVDRFEKNVNAIFDERVAARQADPDYENESLQDSQLAVQLEMEAEINGIADQLQAASQILNSHLSQIYPEL